MRVFAPAPLRIKLKVGEVAFLFTHLVVREDALTLYGFESQADRDLFNLLLGVDGVGPKVALSVLSTMTLDAIQRAVFADEPDVLSRVPGVGKKTAERMVLELKDKVADMADVEAIDRGAVLTAGGEDAVKALIALGIRRAQAEQAVQRSLADHPDAPAPILTRHALGALKE